MGREFYDLTGLVSGNCTVLALNGQYPTKERRWLCVCNCGNLFYGITFKLRRGITKECKECWRKSNKLKGLIHGLRQTPEYRCWQAMINRCYKPKIKFYERYGGRGISVCDRWRESVVNFYNDMGQKPSEHHSLDRINNDGNYEPSNCRWALKKEQAQNRRTTIFITIKGDRKPLTQWAAISGLPRHVIATRYKKKWSEDRLLSPVSLKHSH